MMTAPLRITNFPRLDESVQFFLPILEAHAHVGVAPGPPEEVEIVAEPLALIERGDRPKHPVTAFKSDGGVDLRCDRFGRGIEKILPCLAELEVRVERDGQRLGTFHLGRLVNCPGAGGEGETGGSQQDSHDASIKRDEGIGVNFPSVRARRRKIEDEDDDEHE